MLIIGHRGSRGTHPENSITGLREAIRAGADMVEFDVRLTSDGELVLYHDFHLYRTHRTPRIIRRMTLRELQRQTAGSEHPVVTLTQALKTCDGRIMINIEIKDRGAGKKVIELIKHSFPHLMKEIMISSFSTRELRSIRRISKRASLGLLLNLNPYAFLVYERQLHLSAVGFHRLHAPELAIETARRMDILTYAYTVNRPDAIAKLAEKDIDAIVTDYPGSLRDIKPSS